MKLLLLVLLLCLPSQAAITLVAHAFAGGAGTALIASLNCTGANFATAVASDFNVSAAAGAFLSTGTPTWHALTNSNDGSSRNSAIWYAYNITGGATDFFQKTGSFPAIFVSCWSGVQSASDPFDQQAQAQGSSPLGAGSITPSANNELVIAGMCNNDSGISYSIDSSYTITDQSPLVGGSNAGGALGYIVQTSAAATNPQWTSGSGTISLAATTASFKVAPAGGYVANPTVIVVGP